MTISKSALLLGGFATFGLLFTACFKDDTNSGTDNQTGQLQLEMTDAPVDDPNVKGVFVTVTEIKVDGQHFDGFSGKKTIDLMAYQNGDVALLGVDDLDAGSYQNITLVLDNASDASGNVPGSYVLLNNGDKHSLSGTGSQQITLAKDFTVKSGKKTNLVIDFDLHKAIQYQGTGSSSDQYDLVASADLQTAIRVINKDSSGTVTGQVSNGLILTDKVVAYAYKKGQFNRTTEMQADAGITFKNAVSSAVADENGNFTLAFLEDGDYEIHFAAYKDNNSDGRLDLQGTLVVTSLLDLGALRLDASGQLDLAITVTGIQP